MKTRIRELRKSRGLRQEDVAKHANVSARVVSGWERGETEITLLDACAIADLLQVSLDELAGREWNDDGLSTVESKLITDYRATDDLHKAFLSEQASNAALQHPKNEGQRYQAVAA